jgi:hypothetical protein
LLPLISHKDQIPQMMSITQCIENACILEVRPVAIVHCLAFEDREDANCIQCFAASFPVRRIIRQESGANHMQAPQLAFNPTARFIEMSCVCRVGQFNLVAV